MSEAGDEIVGHCLCGVVQITLQRPGQKIEICQCDMCRRWGGAFYAGLGGASFEISGETEVRTYNSSAWAERAFCGTCGSNLWFKFLPTGNRSFLAGLFDGAANLEIEKEIFSDEAPVWCQLSGSHPRQSGAEAIAEAEAAGFSFD